MKTFYNSNLIQHNSYFNKNNKIMMMKIIIIFKQKFMPMTPTNLIKMKNQWLSQQIYDMLNSYLAYLQNYGLKCNKIWTENHSFNSPR